MAPITFSSLRRKSEAIASDVDGTILSSTQTIHPITRMAIQQAIELSSSSPDSTNQNQNTQPFIFFPATGKSREGALSSLGMEISNLLTESNAPGVYLQGLFCVDGNQNVIFEQKLTHDAISAVEQIVEQEQLSVVAYDGDDLYTTEITDLVTHLHTKYGEPMPQLILDGNEKDDDNNGIGKPLSEHGAGLHKILIMDEDVQKLKTVVRPQLEQMAKKYNASITQAIPTMLEVLPEGCSKAMGVEKVCHALGINMSNELLALGDAENDADMLKQACIGVSMGNGCDIAKKSADYVMKETNDEGAAGLAMNEFAFQKYFSK